MRITLLLLFWMQAFALAELASSVSPIARAEPQSTPKALAQTPKRKIPSRGPAQLFQPLSQGESMARGYLGPQPQSTLQAPTPEYVGVCRSEKGLISFTHSDPRSYSHCLEENRHSSAVGVILR